MHELLHFSELEFWNLLRRLDPRQLLKMDYPMCHTVWLIHGGPFFGPEKCWKEFILTWWTCFEYSILVHFISLRNLWSRVQIRFWSTFQQSEFWSRYGIKSESGSKSNYWKVDQNRIWTRDHKFRIETEWTKIESLKQVHHVRMNSSKHLSGPKRNPAYYMTHIIWVMSMIHTCFDVECFEFSMCAIDLFWINNIY